MGGVLGGLAAGDKNGGPQRLAMLLAYSVFTQQKFDVNNIWNLYSKWYEKGGFDTGNSFIKIYKALQQQNKETTTPTKICQILYDSVIANNEIPSIGIGSGHRAAVLSMFPFFIDPFQQNEEKQDDKLQNIKVQKLQNVAVEESCLTHYAPLCRHYSIAINYLCRSLIIGYEWTDALKICYEHIENEEIKEIILIFIQNKGIINKNNYKMK